MERATPCESPIESIIVRNASELESPAREWLQGLVGRPLRDDENVTILLSVPHSAPPAAERRAAFLRMENILDRAAENMRNLPDERARR